jgi:hypothetical protein
MPYDQVQSGLQRARSHGVLEWDEEPSEQGEGVRYRYRVAPHWREVEIPCGMERALAWTQ